MKGYKNWATACFAVTLTCVLAGCGQTSAGNAQTTSIPSGTLNQTPKPIAAGPENFDIVSLTAPQSVTVEGASFNPGSEPSINGRVEPVVLTVHFVEVTRPIYLNLQKFELDNPSANVGGVIAYFKYNGAVRRVFSSSPGSFPVSNTMVVSHNSTITLVCSVGTPVPPAKVDIIYNNMNLGSYSASTVGSYTLS